MTSRLRRRGSADDWMTVDVAFGDVLFSFIFTNTHLDRRTSNIFLKKIKARSLVEERAFVEAFF